MDVKDKALQTILNFGIGILYPILVYFAISTFVPNPIEPDSTLETRGHEQLLRSQDNRMLLKTSLALLIAVATFLLTVYFIRHLRKIVRGLVGGAGMVVFLGGIWLAGSYSGDRPDIQFEQSVLLMVSFVLLTLLMYWVEHNLPRGDVSGHAKPVKTE